MPVDSQLLKVFVEEVESAFGADSQQARQAAWLVGFALSPPAPSPSEIKIREAYAALVLAQERVRYQHIIVRLNEAKAAVKSVAKVIGEERPHPGYVDEALVRMGRIPMNTATKAHKTDTPGDDEDELIRACKELGIDPLSSR